MRFSSCMARLAALIKPSRKLFCDINQYQPPRRGFFFVAPLALFTFAVDVLMFLLCSGLRGASWTACNFSI